jgi:hypothetical protein
VALAAVLAAPDSLALDTQALQAVDLVLYDLPSCSLILPGALSSSLFSVGQLALIFDAGVALRDKLCSQRLALVGA